MIKEENLACFSHLESYLELSLTSAQAEVEMDAREWISGHFVFLQKDKAAKANTAASKASRKQRSGSVIGKYVDGRGILRSQRRRKTYSAPPGGEAQWV